MKFEDLEHIYNHWYNEYLFYKDNSITGIMLIFILYFASLYSLISNKNIEFGYFMYAVCIYCVLWTIFDIFKLKNAMEQRDKVDKDLLKILKGIDKK